ncbi:hypothetical protein WJ977_24850 [Achromobacter xylosoxidans]
MPLQSRNGDQHRIDRRRFASFAGRRARGLFPGGSRIAGRTRGGLARPRFVGGRTGGFLLGSRLFGSLLQQQFSDCGELF